MSKTKVLIIDDSALMRKLLTELLAEDAGIEVVGAAPDPYVAREKIKALSPDVITLDVEMPRMDGITFLRNLMRLRPMPVVMVSSLTEKGADITLTALELGAVDFVAKPKLDVEQALQEYADEIRAKVKAAARVSRQWLERPRQPIQIIPRLDTDAVLAKTGRTHFRTTEQIVAVGASTGGTEAIKEVLSTMAADAPAMVITQHIPAAFSGPFAERMNRCSAMVVREAQDGAPIIPGHAFIAPGDRHLLVARDGARYVCRLSDGPPVNRHRPSVDVLFRSVADNVGPNAVGVILTGMGDDGARGMREMRDAGAATVAQDERTSVVWGMPGEAVKHGGVGDILPLPEIARKILELTRDRESGKS